MGYKKCPNGRAERSRDLGGDNDNGGGDNGGGDNGEGDHTPESRALIGQLAPAHFTFHTIVNAMQFCF